jgi:hypothetical protein
MMSSDEFMWLLLHYIYTILNITNKLDTIKMSESEREEIYQYTTVLSFLFMCWIWSELVSVYIHSYNLTWLSEIVHAYTDTRVYFCISSRV